MNITCSPLRVKALIIVVSVVLGIWGCKTADRSLPHADTQLGSPAPYEPGPGFEPAQIPPTDNGPDPQEVLETQYTLGAGDRLQITIFGEDDLSGEYQVDGSGYISLPLIGEVRARGLSLRNLERYLVEKYKDGYLKDPSISLEVLNYRPFYILGEVEKPGKYEYISGITLHNAVAMAGGYTHRARRNRAEITRMDPEIVIENANHSTVILPGDIINIPQRFF